MAASEYLIEESSWSEDRDGAVIAQLVDATSDYELLPAESAAGLGL